MGTTVSLLLPQARAEAGARVVRALFAEWEERLSRFRPESELSRLNARAGESVAVSGLLYTVLTAALRAARATNGLYDPTMGQQLVTLGYDRSFEEVAKARGRSSVGGTIGADPGDPTDAAGGAGGAWRRIAIEPETRRVRLPVGVSLDFGGIAKGMAVDAAVERLRQVGIAPALVNAGGDLAVLGQPSDGADWPIAVAAGKDAAHVVPLRWGALATSGIARRRWRQGDRERHHLLDPRTGLPVTNELWSVSVAAAWCEQAEVAAKVAFVLGTKAGAAFLCAHGLAGMLVGTDSATCTVGAWPKEPETLGAGYERMGRGDVGYRAGGWVHGVWVADAGRIGRAGAVVEMADQPLAAHHQ